MSNIILNNIIFNCDSPETNKPCLIIKQGDNKYCVPVKLNDVKVGDKCLIIQSGNNKYCIPVI